MTNNLGTCYSCSIIFAMACCGARSLTPLAQYARSLRTQLDDGEKLPMLFPMYTVPLGTLLEMTKIEHHEALKARDVLVEFQRNMGNAAFVSHQWVDHQPPRPRLQADKGLAGCSEGNDGQLEKHTCRLNFRRAKYKFQAFAHIEDSVRTAVLLVWLFLVPTERLREASGTFENVPQKQIAGGCHQQHTGICGRVLLLFCPCTSLGESEWNQSDHSIHLE